jgi:hypothetical protein
MAIYIIQRISDSKYVDTTEWDGGAQWAPPSGHTAVLATPVNLAQFAVDKAAEDAARLAEAHIAWRDEASRFLVNDPRPEMKAMRGLFYALLDEINVLRQWITTFKTQTAAASSLANFQSRVASNTPNMPDRTPQQGLNAILDKVTDGSAD